MSYKQIAIENRHGTFIENHRCSGDCCQLFCIMGKTVEELKELINAGNYSANDQQIPNMIVPLSYEEYVIKANELRKDGLEIIKKDDYNNNWFRCKNYDAVEKICRIYDTRPDMCRTYPYCRGEKGCEYRNCTLNFQTIDSPKEVISK